MDFDGKARHARARARSASSRRRPGHPRLGFTQEGVDGRDKPGHDEKEKAA
jgi:hypothetical protein